LADQTTTKPADLIYEDTGAMAPVVYFDIVGAYGTMNGAVEVELATRILVPKPDGSTEVKFISSGRIRCTPERRHQSAQRPRCRAEDAGAAAGQYGGLRGGVEAELSGTPRSRNVPTLLLGLCTSRAQCGDSSGFNSLTGQRLG
jgi:hypothetical protein